MSASKFILKDRQIITDGAMTGTATLTSTEIDCTSASIGAVQIVFTGTPIGTFNIQGCVNVDQFNVGVNWNNLTTVPSSLTASGSASSYLVGLADIGYNKIRVVYTNTSGTGTAQVYITIKGD